MEETFDGLKKTAFEVAFTNRRRDGSRRKIIGFDLDQTLCRTEPFNFGYDDTMAEGKIYHRARPNEEMIQVVRDYSEADWWVYIFTARNERFRPITEDWLGWHVVPYNTLVMNKLYLDIYVGDEVRTPEEMLMVKKIMEDTKW
jgi:hypothetical protein